MSRRLAEGEVVRLVSRGAVKRAVKRMEVHTRDSISVGELTRSMPRLSGVVFERSVACHIGLRFAARVPEEELK